MRLFWLVLLSLGACSPYPFSKEVSGISTGVDQVSSGFTAGYAALTADRAASAQYQLTSRRSKASLAPSCGVPVGTSAASQLPCVVFPAGDTPPGLAKIEQERDKIMGALTGLQNYAHALAAVTNAADRTAYDAAVAQLSGSVGALAKNADAAAPGLSTIAPAAVNLVGWVVGTALDQQRFDSLKAAVNAVDKPLTPGGANPIHVVAGTLAIGLEDLGNARREILRREAVAMASTLGSALKDAAYRQRLSDLQAVLTVLDGLRHSDPAGTTSGLEQAHDALVKAVNDQTRQYAALLKAVGDFADKAATLRSAFAATANPSTPAPRQGA